MQIQTGPSQNFARCSCKPYLRIFIDGLDEINPFEGPVELLDLVEQFSRCGNAKLCLSSRPEPILEQRLSVYPHMRLQDLTRTDLERYARDHTKLTRPIYDESQSSGAKVDKNPIDLFVDKAESVFLWLVLATKSINKGFTCGDTDQMIRQRIDCLPGDLMRLYQDMWNRACEDNPAAYRQIAALYFRLILFCKRGSLRRSPFDLSSLQLMLASTPVANQLLDAINSPVELVSEEKLLEGCRAVEKKLKLYCFGLIETISTPSGDGAGRVLGWYGSQYDTLWSRYGRTGLHFVHRTAQDFLVDTVDGLEILSHDSTSESWLFFKWVKAHLATSQLYANTTSTSPSIVSLVSYYIDILDRFPQEGSCPGNSDRAQTIRYLDKLCSSGQLLNKSHGIRLRFYGGMDFLKVAARIHSFHGDHV